MDYRSPSSLRSCRHWLSIAVTTNAIDCLRQLFEERLRRQSRQGLTVEGTPPFEADTAIGTIHKHRQEPVRKLERPSVPKALESLIRLCLAKNPDFRPTAPEVEELLLLLQKGKLADAELWLNNRTHEPLPPNKNAPKFKFVLACLGLAAVSAIIFFWRAEQRAVDAQVAPASNSNMPTLKTILSQVASHKGALSLEDKTELEQYRRLRRNSLNKERTLSDAYDAVLAYKDTNAALCNYACDVALDTLPKLKDRSVEYNRDQLAFFAHHKCQSLYRLKAANRRAEIDSALAKFSDESGSTQILDQCHIELAVQDTRLADAERLISRYIEQYPYKSCPLSSTILLLSACAVLEDFQKTLRPIDFSTLAEKVYSWLTWPVKNQIAPEDQKFIATIVLLAGSLNPELGNKFWTLLDAKAQHDFEFKEPFDQVFESRLSADGQWTEACRHYLKKAELISASNGSDKLLLESYRMAIYCASQAQPERIEPDLIPDSALKEVQRLFEKLLLTDPEFWVERLAATVQQERDLGATKQSAALLNLLSPQILRTASQEARADIQRLRATRQTSN